MRSGLRADGETVDPGIRRQGSHSRRAYAFALRGGRSGAGIAAETVTAMVVKELIERHVGGRLRLTGYGRVVLRAMLPDL